MLNSSPLISDSPPVIRPTKLSSHPPCELRISYNASGFLLYLFTLPASAATGPMLFPFEIE